jgi:tetratricopeptide (TPR) repeat protein
MPEKIALSMIVRDAEETLERCLESVRGAVDEIYIADTGSQDGTVGIAKKFGAKITSFSWPNDFAAARNIALREVNADWVLSLDADEMLDSRGAAEIRRLVEGPAAGYQVTIRNYMLSLNERVWDRAALPNNSPELAAAQKYPAYVEHQNVRLFQKRADLYFTGRVHESVGPRLEQLRLPLGAANFVIHHFGLAEDAEKRARKNELYYDMGLRKIEEDPRDAQGHFEVGLIELDNFNHTENALRRFRKACQLKPRFAEAWFFSGLASSRLEQYEQALAAFDRAEKLGHETSIVAEMQGDSLYNLRRFAEAAGAYRKALERSGAKAELESKLGLAIVRAGDRSAGFELLRGALEKDHRSGILHDRLVLAFVHCDLLEAAALAAEDKCRNVLPQPTDILRAASLWSQAGKKARAAALLDVGRKLFPESKEFRADSHECTTTEKVHHDATATDSNESKPSFRMN